MFQIWYRLLLMFGRRFFCRALRGNLRVHWERKEAFGSGEDG